VNVCFVCLALETISVLSVVFNHCVVLCVPLPGHRLGAPSQLVVIRGSALPIPFELSISIAPKHIEQRMHLISEIIEMGSITHTSHYDITVALWKERQVRNTTFLFHGQEQQCQQDPGPFIDTKAAIELSNHTRSSVSQVGNAQCRWVLRSCVYVKNKIFVRSSC